MNESAVNISSQSPFSKVSYHDDSNKFASKKLSQQQKTRPSKNKTVSAGYSESFSTHQAQLDGEPCPIDDLKSSKSDFKINKVYEIIVPCRKLHAKKSVVLENTLGRQALFLVSSSDPDELSVMRKAKAFQPVEAAEDG